MERVKGIEPSSRFHYALQIAAIKHFMNIAFCTFQEVVAFCRSFVSKVVKSGGKFSSPVHMGDRLGAVYTPMALTVAILA
jgi:hypothetical protein